VKGWHNAHAMKPRQALRELPSCSPSLPVSNPFFFYFFQCFVLNEQPQCNADKVDKRHQHS